MKLKVIEVYEKSVVIRYLSAVYSEEQLAVDGNRDANGVPVRCVTDSAFDITARFPDADSIVAMARYSAPSEVQIAEMVAGLKAPPSAPVDASAGALAILNREFDVPPPAAPPAPESPAAEIVHEQVGIDL